MMPVLPTEQPLDAEVLLNLASMRIGEEGGPAAQARGQGGAELSRAQVCRFEQVCQG
jgi:hypothetical protein